MLRQGAVGGAASRLLLVLLRLAGLWLGLHCAQVGHQRAQGAHCDAQRCARSPRRAFSRLSRLGHLAVTCWVSTAGCTAIVPMAYLSIGLGCSDVNIVIAKMIDAACTATWPSKH